jgi:hypothetical protein
MLRAPLILSALVLALPLWLLLLSFLVSQGPLSLGSPQLCNVRLSSPLRCPLVLRFQFQYPAVYTMVIRALGSLEGTATALDPSFKVLASAYPFVVGRLLADPTPEVRSRSTRSRLYVFVTVFPL